MGWFRWYEGSCEDIKFRIVARNVSVTEINGIVTEHNDDVTVATVMGVWAMLLEDASHPEHRGVAIRGKAFWREISGLSTDTLDNIFACMADVGLISIEDHGLVVTRWSERQFETDLKDNTNAERQRKWREKQKQNGTVTERNGERNGGERPDTEAEAYTEAKSETESADAYKGRFVKRVTEKSMQELQAICPHLTRSDILKELSRCDAYYSEQDKPPKSWWFTTTAWFERDKKRHGKTQGYQPNPALRGVL